MTFALLAPLGLSALAALLIPIVIHLVRRLELDTFDFAALRWIDERARPQHRLRIERPWLLLLRLMLLALLALLLAQPVLLREETLARAYVAVVPGVDRSTAAAFASAHKAEWHWLAPGFPSLDVTPSSSGAVATASLLRELDATLAASTRLTVFVPQTLAGLDGEHVRLARDVDWQIVANDARTTERAVAAAPLRLSVRGGKRDAAALVYLRAAVAAWNVAEPDRYALDIANDDVAIAPDAKWLVWLGGQLPAAVSAWIERGGIALVADSADAKGAPLWRSAQSEILARDLPTGRGRVIALAGALTPADLPLVLDADFPDRLLFAFAGPAPPPTRAPATVAKPLHDAVLAADPPRDLSHAQHRDEWLAILIASLFLFERIVATRRRAEPVP